MPRQRQRIVFCDCYDCVDRPAEASLSEDGLKVATAMARQEPPPKGLIILASGFLLATSAPAGEGTAGSAAQGAQTTPQLNLDACTLPHLNHLVNEGNLGTLASRAQPASSSPGLHDLSQMLGVSQDLQAVSGSPEQLLSSSPSLPSIASRYKGMEALFASSSASACTLARAAGLGASTAAQALLAAPSSVAGAGAGAAAGSGADAAGSGGAGGSGVSALPDAQALANAIVGELGPEEGASGPDLFVLHLDASDLLPSTSSRQDSAAGGGGSPEQQHQQHQQEAEEAAWDASLDALAWLDALLKHLMAHAGVRDRTLLSLVLSPHNKPLPAPASAIGASGTSTSTSASAPPAATSAHVLQPGGAESGIVLDTGARVMTPGMLSITGATMLDMMGGAVSSAAGSGATGNTSVVRPLQSFQFCGEEQVDIATAAPLLVARRLPGVVRRDRAAKLGVAEALGKGGMGCILLDRLLPEMAYKLARAPKYGA